MTTPAEHDADQTRRLTSIASYELHLARLRRTIYLLYVGWTVALALVFAWHFREVQQHSLAALRIQATGAVDNDIIYRRWAAKHGGVYAPVAENAPPNPHLANIPERDITTPAGRELTLINPAYMTRQVHELGLQEYGRRGHITSLKPLRPENAPDPWETKALQSFQGGASETSEVVRIDGAEYMRYMRPLFTEAACLRCHAAQGYKEGELRGGISVTLPTAPFRDIAAAQATALATGYVLIWLLGILGIAVGGERNRRRVDERDRAKRALVESERRFKAMFENSPLGYQALDENGDIIEVNRAWTEVLGYTKEEATGKNFSALLPPEACGEFANNFKAFKERGYTLGTEFKMIKKDGSEVLVSFDGKIGRNEDGSFKQSHCLLQDITERRQEEEEKQKLSAHFLQSQKMESIGILAGGVAHEINNPLNIVSNCAELILDDVEPGGAVARNVDNILEASTRIATIVKSLLAFAGQDRESYRTARVADIVKEALSLILKVLQKDQIDVVVEIPEDLPSLKCHRQQIQQVLINILTNARDALNARYPDYDEGKIIRLVAKSAPGEGEEWIRITVANHGGAIPENVQACMFDPFFTTKPRNAGTGLGLSASHGIVTEHGGMLTVESEEDGWASFHIDLPANPHSSGAPQVTDA